MDANLVLSPQAAGQRLWTRREWLGTALLGLAAGGCHRSPHTPTGRSIRVLVRDSYFSESRAAGRGADVESELFREKMLVVGAFEWKTGIQVKVETFHTADELLERLSRPGVVYDLVLVPGYLVERLRRENLLNDFLDRPTPITIDLPLHYESPRLPNLRYVDSDQYALKIDPNHAFSVPYLWGSLGIGYNMDREDDIPQSWENLFTLLPSQERGEVALLDDSRLTLCTALIYLNHLPGTREVAEIEAAGELVISLSDRVHILEPGKVREALETGKVDIALAWSGDTTGAMTRNARIRLALPSEGSIKLTQCFVVPRSAVNQADAEAFLNHLLEPQVAAEITNVSCFANTLTAARPYVDRLIIAGGSYFSNSGGRERDFDLADTNEMAATFDRVWADVKLRAGRPPAPPV